MREIKFRGKKEYDGKWIEGFYFKTEVGSFIGSYNEEEQVFEETIGQFTGLTDKNGKEIFEGDIIKEHESEYLKEYRLYIVYWDDNYIQYWISDYLIGDAYPLEELETSISEVIGNIHDNRELLNEPL